MFDLGLFVGIGIVAGLPALMIAGLAKTLLSVGTTPTSFAVFVSAIYLTMAVALPYVLAACASGD